MQTESTSNDKALVDAKTFIESDFKYKIVKMLAKGGMAYVFQATDTNCQRTVALKMMIDDKNKEKELVRRFIEEAQITSQLNHPAIVPIYEFSRTPNGHPFYVMKMIKGETLQSILDELKKGNPEYLESFPIMRLIDIFIKICDAISFAASRDVVHRDLKPDNIMIGEYGEVYVMDWGIAKLCNALETKELMRNKLPEDLDDSLIKTISTYADVDISSTFHGQMLGTPMYMAPEQMCTDYHVDPRADIYALGSILYTILTLQTPHISTKIKVIAQEKIKGEIISPSKRIRNSVYKNHLEMPSSLESVIQKAMSLHPDDRYQSAGLLRKDIEAWINGYATEAEGASQARLLKLLFIRHRRLGVVISLLICSIIVFIYQINSKLQVALLDQDTAIASASSSELISKQQKLKHQQLRARLSESQKLGPLLLDYIDRLIAEENYEKAIEVAEKLVILDGCMDNHRLLIKLCILNKNFEMANSKLSSALERFPNETQLLSLLDQIH